MESQITHCKTEKITQKYINEVSNTIICCAIEVQKHIGIGLLESFYESCFIDEMRSAGLFVEAQIYVPVHYKGKDLGGNLKLHLLVNDLVIVEGKALGKMKPLYKAQLITYLKLTGKPKGLLINFHCENIKENLVSIVTEEFVKLPKG